MNLIIFIIILLIIMLGIIIVMISFYWLFVWIGFEMNMFVIIFIMMKNYNLWVMEVLIKYFLI